MASNILTWQDNSTNETAFEIERKDGPIAGAGTFAKIGSVGTNVATFMDGTVVEGATYAYRVRATNSAGPSSYSNSVERTVPFTIPAAPSNLVVAGGV